MKKLDAIIAIAFFEDEKYCEQIQGLRENLNKLYLNLQTERAIQENALKKDEKIILIQIPFLVESFFREMTVYFINKNSSESLMRVYLNQQQNAVDFLLTGDTLKIAGDEKSFEKLPGELKDLFDFFPDSS